MGSCRSGCHEYFGAEGGLVSAGPCRFTRNPQYLGDIILFVGLSVVANSMLLWIAHALLILVFVIAPMAEEPWLEEQYGEAYREYRRRCSQIPLTLATQLRGEWASRVAPAYAFRSVATS